MCLLADFYTQSTSYDAPDAFGGGLVASAPSPPGVKDKSCLFDILRKERQQTEEGEELRPDITPRDPFFDLRQTLEQLNMSTSRRNGLNGTQAAATAKVSTANNSESLKAKPTTRRSKQQLEENVNLLLAAGASSSSAVTSSTDDERTMRLRTSTRSSLSKQRVNNGEEKKTGFRSIRSAAASSGAEDRRSQKSDATSPKNDNIRTTRTSRLRAAAQGI